MEVKSTYKYARMSAFKAREVAREIQGKPVGLALDILTFTPKKAAGLINKTLRSAIANAENNNNLDVATLTVKEAVIGEGPTLKRFRPKARGSAGRILKRTSHIFITLTDEVEIPEPRKRSAKPKGKAAKTPKSATATAGAAPDKPIPAADIEPDADEPTAAAEVETPAAEAEAPAAEAPKTESKDSNEVAEAVDSNEEKDSNEVAK